MQVRILLGDEAIAQAALDAGIAAAFSYPGTPATEIFEHVEAATAKGAPVFARWSTNEKVALEEALGASYAGRRSIVSMKHVGLNVAADPFMNAAITGANGGLLLVVADDPSMHSSQNEQDSRYYAQFGQVPCLEPADQQEAYDMAFEGLALSEELELPILLRMVTRLSHSRAGVETRAAIRPEPRPVVTDPRRFTLLPVNARRNWARLVARWAEVEARMAGLRWNRLELRGRRLGVVASGIAWNYLMENQPGEDVSLLKVGSYPPPRALFEALLDHCERILVLEDGYPFLEQALLGLLGRTARPMHGRLDGSLPRTGELNPSIVRRALGLPALESASPELGELPGRPPALCKGCPHADTYRVIREVMDGHPEGRVFSDIGCYTLGALAPYEAIHTCVDMGASVSMAHGAAVVGLHPSLAVIGDSTFAHSGITPLLDAVRNDTRMVLIILDNDITAMTGRQESACTGEKLVRLLLGLGVPEAHLRRIRPHPKDHAANVAVLREEIEHPGLSVILAVRPCIQIRPA